jgi:hypothetical protein
VIALDLGALVYVTVYSIHTCTSKLKIATGITGMVFTILSCLFGITGVAICKRLKMYFPEFYSENGKMIALATGGLTVSLLIRGIGDNLRYFSMPIEDHINKYEAVYNPLLLVFCDIIPICFQLSTLIFGYIRKRNDKKYRLEIKLRREEGELICDPDESDISVSMSGASNASTYFDPPLMRCGSYLASSYSGSMVGQKEPDKLPSNFNKKLISLL